MFSIVVFETKGEERKNLASSASRASLKLFFWLTVNKRKPVDKEIGKLLHVTKEIQLGGAQYLNHEPLFRKFNKNNELHFLQLRYHVGPEK